MSNGAKQSFQYILSDNGQFSQRSNYTTRGELVDREMSLKDKRFVFHWSKMAGVGVALSREMGDTTLVKLFMQNRTNRYFEAVKLSNPGYQIWKVHGDKYDK